MTQLDSFTSCSDKDRYENGDKIKHKVIVIVIVGVLVIGVAGVGKLLTDRVIIKYMTSAASAAT